MISDLVQKHLNGYGIARLKKFMTFQEGWDFGEGAAFCEGSLTTLNLLFEHFQDCPQKPQVFLNLDGCIELLWVGKKDVEVGCFQNYYEYFIEETQDEGVFGHLKCQNWLV